MQSDIAKASVVSQVRLNVGLVYNYRNSILVENKFFTLLDS